MRLSLSQKTKIIIYCTLWVVAVVIAEQYMIHGGSPLFVAVFAPLLVRIGLELNNYFVSLKNSTEKK